MIRTGYSFRHAVGHIDEVLDRLVAIGWKHAPIADRLSTFGYVRWSKAAKKRGLNPVYGVELPVVKEHAGGSRVPDSCWRFLAIDSLAPIHALVEKATNQSDRALTYHDALAIDGVIKILGERSMLDENINPDHPGLYFGLSPAVPKSLYNQAKTLGYKMIAISDNVYTNKDDRELYRVALGNSAQNKSAGTQTYPQWILSDEEWSQACWFADANHKKSAINTRSKVLERCRASLPKGELLKPTARKTLRDLCIDGAKTKKINLKNQTYKERLDRELTLIAEKKYEDYFFIIADLVQYAKQLMLVGPGRGSAAGSLVCYLLDITSVDPIRFNLLFERFIDVNRSDLPDIDLDFSDTERHHVFEYVEKKYQKERVARLGTVGLFKAQSAINQVGKELGIPKWMTEAAMNSVVEHDDGDERALRELEDTFKLTDAGKELINSFPEAMIATRLEGHPNVASQHAAGIIITDKPVINYVAIDKRTNATMCDRKDAEELGLLKIDALGLKQLSIFERTLDLLKIEENPNIFLNDLPLDDAAAFDVLNRGKFAGVFQFEGYALSALTEKIKVKDIEHMVSLTSLARPGPMDSAGSWVKRMNGVERIAYAHPLFEPFLHQTQGHIVYQEQVMQIAREIGGMSWSEVSSLRRAISKSLGREIIAEQFGNKFRTEAVKRGIPSNIADKVFDDMCAFGSYAFNRSHAVAYSIISYWCCWFKAHHLSEFMAATLDSEKLPENQIPILRELDEAGIGYVPVDVDYSTDRWVPAERDGKKLVVGSLYNIEGFGPVKVREVVDSRATGKPLRAGLVKQLMNAKTSIDSLYPIYDSVRKIAPGGLSSVGIVSTPKPIKPIKMGRDEPPVVIIGKVKRLSIKNENAKEFVDKRNGRVLPEAQSKSLNIWLEDDTGEILCKISRGDAYNSMAQKVIDKAQPGKSIYAISGKPNKHEFRMIWVDRVRHLGEME